MIITPSIVMVMCSAGACFMASIMAFLNKRNAVIAFGIVAILFMGIAIHIK